MGVVRNEKNECEVISMEEVRSTLRMMKGGKAAEPDGIAAEGEGVCYVSLVFQYVYELDAERGESKRDGKRRGSEKE